MTKWEYVFISCVFHEDDWRPRWVNGEEIENWQEGDSIYQISNKLGEERWELVNLVTDQARVGTSASFRLVFKRTKE